MFITDIITEFKEQTKFHIRFLVLKYSYIWSN